MKKRFTAADFARFHRVTALSAGLHGLAAFAETTVERGENVSAIHILRGGECGEIVASFAGRSPAWSPDGSALAWLADWNGADQIFLCAPDGDNVRRLTSLRHGVVRFAWSPDGGSIAFEAEVWPEEPPFECMDREERKAWERERRLAPRCTESIVCKHDALSGMVPPSVHRIGVVNLKDGEQRFLSEEGVPAVRPVWSPDGSRIACYDYPNKGTNALRAAIRVCDADGSRPHRVAEGAVMLAEADICFASDGRSLIYSAFDLSEGEVELLYRVPVEGGEPKCLFECGDEICHGVNCMPTGRTFAVIENSYVASAGGWVYFLSGWKGHNSLYRISEDGGAPEVVLRTDGSLSAFCPPMEGRILCMLGDAGEPGDLYWLNREGCVRLTRRNPWLEDCALAKVSEHWVSSRDGREKIQTWIVHPVGEEPGRRYPAVLYVRGGPDCTWVVDFWHEMQVLAAAGMAVVYCNPRGSMGYGRGFADSRYAWGDEALHDLLDALQFAVDCGIADPGRLGVTGGSYGGYMTNKLVGESDIFRAAVSQRPLVNTATSYGTGDLGFASQGKSPEEIAKITMKDYIGGRVRGGLMGYVERINAHMLFLHAFNDLRCSYEQSEQMFNALRERRKELQLRLLMLPGDNHGVARNGRPVNLMRHVEEMTLWFRRHLCGEEVVLPGDGDGIYVAETGGRASVREAMWPLREGREHEWSARVKTLELPTQDGMEMLTVHVTGDGDRQVICPCEHERLWIPEMERLTACGCRVYSFEARKDVHLAAADALTVLDAAGLAGRRAGILGFGAGGTAALWLAACTKRFAACAAYGATPSRLIAYASSDAPGGSGDYETFRDFMWASMNDSPVFYAEKIDVPVLLMHGEQDRSAPVEGAHQMYIALKDTHPERKNRLVLFPEAGHEPPLQREALDGELARWFMDNLQ